MQIQLKQLEIVAALKMFISNQGINLTGKTVEIAFTSGRKDNGLSAEITIEDANAPAQLGSYTVSSTPLASLDSSAPVVNSATSEATAVAEETTAPVIKPVSLFSSN